MKIAVGVIATSPETHYSTVKSTIAAGKDMFMEKPIALRDNEAEPPFDKEIEVLDEKFVVERPTLRIVNFPAAEPHLAEGERFLEFKTSGEDGWPILKVLDARQWSASMNGESIQPEPRRSWRVFHA